MFKAWCNHVGTYHKMDGAAQAAVGGDRPFIRWIERFAADIGTIWPEWNVQPEAPKVGATVTLPAFGKTPESKGTVLKTGRGRAICRFEGMPGTLSVPFGMLKGA